MSMDPKKTEPNQSMGDDTNERTPVPSRLLWRGVWTHDNPGNGTFTRPTVRVVAQQRRRGPRLVVEVESTDALGESSWSPVMSAVMCNAIIEQALLEIHAALLEAHAALEAPERAK